MPTPPPSAAPRRPLRVWPGVVLGAIILVLRFIVPIVAPDLAFLGILAGIIGGVAVLVWWLFFSRAPWIDRLAAPVLMVLAVVATMPFLHSSIATGMMGMMFYVYAVPATLSLALAAWAIATRGASDTLRRMTMVIAILLGAFVWTLTRTEGIIGAGVAQLKWRWTPSPEERLLAQSDESSSSRAAPALPIPTKTTGEEPARPTDSGRTAAEPPIAASDGAPDARGAAEWPGFRGPARNAVIGGVRIATDWSSSAPVELWRRPVGPGWSSFAVDGDLVYTQEQRGEHEIVACYRLMTGDLVWTHKDTARFYESNGGAGPRGTPAVHGGRVYAMGATGIVNALDARTGAQLWARNAQADTGAQLPGWGFAASPLVVGDLVIVAASGRLVAYAIADGHPRWVRTTGGGGYSSPHLATIGGVEQVVLQSGGGITSVTPADGTVLWQHNGADGVSIVQPGVLPDGDVLTSGGDMMGGTGMRRLAVTRGSGGWSATEKWSTRGLKPYFNDFVVHEGHAYGFDGSILAAIDLATGERKWKGGRYGQGQMLLLAEQDALLILSEEGELALVGASPDKFTELARLKAIEGKTWNHPVLVGHVALVRNGEEMAAFRLPAASR